MHVEPIRRYGLAIAIVCGSVAVRYLLGSIVTTLPFSACFVAVTNEQRVAGYYTLASASVELSDLPEATAKKLPRYPCVPAVRMGRLAVDRDFKGVGLGGALLADALRRCAQAEIAAYALIVDAKDETAADFYRHHGFIALPSSALRLFLPLATVAGLMSTGTSR